MNIAETFTELAALAEGEGAAHATFSTYRSGVFWRDSLDAVAAFYQDPEKEMWVMTHWTPNTTSLHRPTAGFVPIGQAGAYHAKHEAQRSGGNGSDETDHAPALSQVGWG